MSFNFMAVVTIHSDFGAKENETDTVSAFPPFVCYEVIDLEAMIFFFFLNVEF